MNQVDTSPETVEKEWDKLAAEFSVDLSDLSEVSETETENETDVAVINPEDREKKEQLTSEAIVGIVKGFTKLAMRLEIEEGIYKSFGDAWAVIVVNKWPDNPVTMLYEEYEHYILAAWSTFALFGAIKEAKKERDGGEVIENEESPEKTEKDNERESA